MVSPSTLNFHFSYEEFGKHLLYVAKPLTRFIWELSVPTFCPFFPTQLPRIFSHVNVRSSVYRWEVSFCVSGSCKCPVACQS